MAKSTERHSRTIVVGIGCAGSNIVGQLMNMNVTGAECIALDTDTQSLNRVHATHKVVIGGKTTQGLGTGGNPAVGRNAIEESKRRLGNLLKDRDIAFIVAGLGGGTGTGAAPLVAEIARRRGATVVGVVTTPLKTEKRRIEYAAKGLTEMRKNCHTVIVIDNNKLLESAPQLPLSEALKFANQVSANTIKEIIESTSTPSLINLDLADFKTLVARGGVATVGFGESDAPNRAEEAVRNAMRSQLFDINFAGAKGALIHVSGDDHLTIEEVDKVGEIVKEMMQNNATVVWGARVNPNLAGVLKVTLLLTGLNSPRRYGEIGTMTRELFNIDPCTEREEILKIDLDLDQIEDFE